MTRHQALLAVARDNKIPWDKYASDADRAALRGHVIGSAVATASPGAAPKVVPSKTRAPARERTSARAPKEAKPRDKVFVVHGRDAGVRDSMFDFLRAIGLEPVEWGEAKKATGKAMPSISDTLHAGMGDVSAVVVVLTPDDLVKLRPRLQKRNDPDEEKRLVGQARPNVLWEGGMAFGKYPDRTVIVSVGHVKAFSDVGGLHIIRLDDTAAKRSDLAESLRRAGADVKTDGKADWFTVGRFHVEEDNDGDTQET